MTYTTKEARELLGKLPKTDLGEESSCNSNVL